MIFDEATSNLDGCKYYSVLDCYSSFFQIKEEHKEKTGFSVPSRHYEFNRLPFGLSNSQSSFQRLMDIVLKNLVGTECFVFIDDVIIFFKISARTCSEIRKCTAKIQSGEPAVTPWQVCICTAPGKLSRIRTIRTRSRSLTR